MFLSFEVQIMPIDKNNLIIVLRLFWIVGIRYFCRQIFVGHGYVFVVGCFRQQIFVDHAYFLSSSFCHDIFVNHGHFFVRRLPTASSIEFAVD